MIWGKETNKKEKTKGNKLMEKKKKRNDTKGNKSTKKRKYHETGQDSGILGKKEFKEM